MYSSVNVTSVVVQGRKLGARHILLLPTTGRDWRVRLSRFRVRTGSRKPPHQVKNNSLTKLFFTFFKKSNDLDYYYSIISGFVP